MRAEPVVLSESPQPGVTVIRLNRPASLNAMTRELVDELRAALVAAVDDKETRVVVLTGNGRGFCSGHELTALGDEAEGWEIDALMENQRAYSSLVVDINETPLPVIAAVNGPAAGGGMAIALAADVRVCSSTARFNAAFVRLGISGCDVGVSYLLPRIVGPTLAFEMMLSGRLVDADEALRAGLVLRVVPDGQVVETALEIADSILQNSPFAVEMTKGLMWAGLDAPSLRHAVLSEDRTQTLCLRTGDYQEAIPALREKRRTEWGRK
jgi:enoyl-CoA hydratase